MSGQATEVEPELLDLLEEAFNAYLSKHGGPMPAKVETFTPPNLCSATPEIQIYVHGELTTLPTMQQITIAYPEGGGFAIRWPLQQGDRVWLTPAGWDIGPWLSSGSPVPKSRRRWSLSDIIALPFNPRPASAPAPSTGYAAGAMVLEGPLFVFGSSTATDFAALASKVLTELQAIKTWADSHVHTAGTYTNGGGAVTGSSGSPASPMNAPSSVASTRIKTDA